MKNKNEYLNLTTKHGNLSTIIKLGTTKQYR